MNKLHFVKMHGAGNDFIMVDGIKNEVKLTKQLTKKLCNRHTGIGGDGLITILTAEDNNNDFKMRILNSDGSEAEMCGNGIRCFAHYLISEKFTDKKKFNIETKAGIIKPEIIDYSNKLSQVKVNMGKPHFKPADIPVLVDKDIDYIKNYSLKIDEKTFSINCVSMGNPHSIIFTDNIDDINLRKWGKKIEYYSLFPQKTNVEFVEINNRADIKLRVWERGAGITLACGTGACASVAAGIKNDLLNKKVTVHLPGGDLIIDWSDEDIYMTGPAKTVFRGKIALQED